MRKVGVFICIILFSGFSAIAQPEDPIGDPDAVPITGIEILLGAGALLGAKRYLSSRKPKS